MVSVQLDVSVTAALAWLGVYAAAVDQPLVEVACAVVGRRVRLFPVPAQRGRQRRAIRRREN